MKCISCGHENEPPTGESILLEELIDDIDVDVSVQEHIQLECRECEAILGYAGVGAAVGSSNAGPGFY